MSKPLESKPRESKRKNHPWSLQPAVKKHHQDDKEIIQSHEEVMKEVRWSNYGKRGKG